MCCGSSYAPSGGGSGWNATPGNYNREDHHFEVTHRVDGKWRTVVVASKYEADALTANGGGARPVPKSTPLTDPVAATSTTG